MFDVGQFVLVCVDVVLSMLNESKLLKINENL